MPREYVLVDNESTNGTFLNNQQVSRAQLHDGDKVRVGSTILRFSYHDAIDAEYHRRIYDLITYDDLTCDHLVDHLGPPNDGAR